MDSRLAEAKLLKDYARLDIDKATRDKDRIDFEKLRQKALPRLMKAAKLLEEDGEEIKDDKFKGELRQEIADCYGMMGGVYRRLSESGDAKTNLEEAAKMYEKGREKEVDSSYNLSNSVVIPILLDPENLERLQDDIKKGLGRIKELVRGKGKYDWWAWTDLGLFNLLRNDYPAARDAYEQATQLGARSPNYKSTLSVLGQLQKALDDAESPTARSVAQSLADIIQLLQKEKVKLSL